MSDATLSKYRILAEIGKGGFATVYRALDITLDREVALKVLDPILARDPAWVARFQREAKAVARLKHPHIVTIHEIGESEGRLYIAMELIEGPSLAQRIAERGRLPWAEALTILEQVAATLDYAHGQGVLHRDLKPANILLDPARGAILTDFGFARLVGESSMSVSLSGGVVGTPAYIAPEVWDGEEPTSQTDIYSLGCVAYEMLTGEVLFAGKTPSVVMRQHLMDGPRWPDAAHWPAGVPEGMSDVLAHALAKDPAERYASADKLVDALSASGQLAPHRASGVAPAAPPQRDKTPAPARPRPRWLWPTVSAGGLVFLVVLVLVVKGAIESQPPLLPPVVSSTAAPVAAVTTAVPATPTRLAPTSSPSLAPSPTSTPIATNTSSPVPTDTPAPSPTMTATKTPSPTRTRLPTATTTATPTSAPMPAFTVNEGPAAINVRSGPGTVYPVIGAMQAGDTRPVTGRNEAGDWWQFDYNGQKAWVSGQVVTANTEARNVTVASIPPTPVATMGRLILRWGEHGQGPGQFNHPAGITVHDGTVYIGDEENSRIQGFTTDGDYLFAWSVKDKDGQLVPTSGWPKFDGQGFLWVHEWPGSRLLRYEPRGRYLSEIVVPSPRLLPPGIDALNQIFVLSMDGYGYKYDSEGVLVAEWGGPGQFGSPSDLAVDPEGNCYVAATWEHRIVVLSEEGNFLRSITIAGDGLPSSVTVDNKNNLLVTDSRSRRVLVYDKAGKLVSSWDVPRGNAGQWIRGIAVDPEGYIYVADWENDQILKFTGLR